jgi:protein tyrosine phosphatase (PTP) superfamily phosphohydrolase (DUF442 family)
MNQNFTTVIALAAAGLVGMMSCSQRNHSPASVANTDDSAHELEHALHNLHRLDDKLISGAEPDGDLAFDELQAMGIKTIISVDGAAPDVNRAQARGMRYVHIPITYAQVSESQRLEIARAIRDLPGPVYLHCHHGKHRGPAALAAAGVALGMISADQGVQFMKAAGTAPHYKGLYQCVATSAPVSKHAIDSASSEFPSVRHAHGIVAAMVEIDMANDHLAAIRGANWQVPDDHPDLVPAAEAGRLTDNLRYSHQDPKAISLGDDFVARLDQAIADATTLEEWILQSATGAQLDHAYERVQTSCKDCHATHRDVRR